MVPSLELKAIHRGFPGVRALHDVDFNLMPGEVHALVGENGAGKSTLVNLISGVLQPDQGSIVYEGQTIELSGPQDAWRQGIVTVHQEAEFFPSLSVAENMALLSAMPAGRLGFLDWKRIRSRALEVLNDTDQSFDVDAAAESLTTAHRHLMQIAVAVHQNAKVIVLDEPTSSLTSVEVDWLFSRIAQMKAQGVAILYISHRQEEIFQLADRITVLRDGEKIWTRRSDEVTAEHLVTAMVGREPVATELTSEGSGGEAEPLLRVHELSDAQGRVSDISFELRKGEVLGVYGLIGAGRTELAETLFGIRSVASGKIQLGSKSIHCRSPTEAMGQGIAYVPEDRLERGLFGSLSIRANLVISTLARWSTFGLAKSKAERDATQTMVDSMQIRMRDDRQPARQLSGGNQQKLVLGRWLLSDPSLLILDEPTRGVDVGAKAEIHRLIRSVADRGTAVMMISSELPEVLAHSDRILVLREGRVSAEVDAKEASAERIAKSAFPDSSSKPRSPKASATRANKWIKRWGRQTGLLPIVIALTLWLGLTSDGFFDSANLANLLSETALWSILGVAAGIVIICGAIDISIGSLLALSAGTAGIILQSNLTPEVAIPVAILASLAVGTAGGLINGALSLIGKIHPIVVTLGMIFCYRGITITMLRGRQISDLPPGLGQLAIDPETGFRGVILAGVVVILATAILLGFTRTGRGIFALGASQRAAAIVGISRGKTWLIAFGISGFLVGLAAVLELASSMQMQAQLAKGWELQAIAIAVIGGVSIHGGRGSVAGICLGALLLQLVNSALVRWEISGSQVNLVVGGMILAAVVTDSLWRSNTQ